jgi:hypothetical protein
MLTQQLAEEVDWLLLRIGEGRDQDTLVRLARNVREHLDAAPVLDVEIDCPYEAEENVEIVGDTQRWTCPWCGKEHEDEIDDDPDLQNDLRADR